MKKRKEVQAVIRSPEGYLTVRKNNGEWRLLKGGVETGEELIEALKREIKEETGIEGVEVYGKAYSYRFKAGGFEHIVSSFLVMTEETDVDLQEEELMDFEWLEKKDLMGRVSFDNEREAVLEAISLIE